MTLPASSPSIAVVPGQPRSLHRTTIPVPAPGPRDVLVQVCRVGICGTDREIIHGQIGRAPEGSSELVTGHEVLGRVLATGDAVHDLREGELVTATVRRPDGCPACQAGQPDMCLWGNYTERGIKGRHGYMTRYFVENRQYVVPVPEALEKIAVLTEPLTVVEKAVRQADLIQRRMTFWHPRTALVLGAGPIGILGTLLLRSRNIAVATVARTPKPDNAARVVEQAGAEYVSTRQESLADLHRRLGNIDIILESTGASVLAFEAMKMLGINGVLVLLSITGGNHMANVETDLINSGIVAGNKTVVGSVNAGIEDFTNAVAHLGRFDQLWPGLLPTMITGRIPFDANDALAAIATRQEDGIKTVIELGG